MIEFNFVINNVPCFFKLKLAVVTSGKLDNQWLVVGIFSKKFLDFLDHRTNRNMDRNEVVELLDSHGFGIVDMTEINGITYFNTRNQRNSGE